MTKTIYVYEHWNSKYPIKIGTLFVDQMKSGETYSFEYDENWLKFGQDVYKIDPNLELYRGRQYAIDKNMFGVLSDSAPDRWGRTLMKRKEKYQADKDKRKPKSFTESDFLLGVYDKTRMGALRFSLEENGPFLNDDKDIIVPPWATLRDLEEASRGFEMDENPDNEKWLNQLIQPGSSLGGARPKATIQNIDGTLWIAKFPSKHDDIDIGAWEKVTHDMAKLCGLNVPESKIEKFSKLGSTFLVKRFDREGERRIHFASAMTMLSKTDGASSQDGTSYLDIADFIKMNGANPKEDLKELWKRVVFNMAVNNTDDHLRNHGFILTKKGWRLSPLYDVNPVPYGNHLSLNITADDNQISIDAAYELALLLDIEEDCVLDEIKKIISIVQNQWENLALKYNISRSSIEYMRPSFSLTFD